MNAVSAPVSSSKFAWLIPSITTLVFILFFWMNLLFMPRMLNADGDLQRHIVVGRWILDTGTIPMQDVFSHTATGMPLVPKEWLSQVFLALVERVAGWNGVAWLTACVWAASYALLMIGLRRLGVSAPVAGASVIFASTVGAIHQLARPHMFTVLFFTIFAIVLEDFRRTDQWKKLLLLPLLMIVWANLHGVFLVGIALAFFYALGNLFDRKYRAAFILFILVVALALASLINPATSQLSTHIVGYMQSGFLVDQTIEFASPNFHSTNTFPFAILILGSFALGWRSSQRLGWSALIPLIGWIAFALYSARNIPLYAQIAVLILAPLAQTWLAETLPALYRFCVRIDNVDRVTSGWVWAGAFVGLLIVMQANGVKSDIWNQGNTIDPRTFPVAAVDFLQKDLPAGEMFNDFNWGGYLLYRLFPTKRVFIDSFTDFYGEALTREYLQIVDGTPGWEAKLAARNVRWIIIPPDRPLARWLNQSIIWSRVFQDETASVWIKR